jgi:hypothetical protein
VLLLAGTIPIRDLPLALGMIALGERNVTLDGQTLDVNRGTAAMMSAACTICREYGLERPVGLIAGDIGARDGSGKIYGYLADNLPAMGIRVLTMHYIMPEIKKNKEVLAKIAPLKEKPVLIADAGGMYSAKAGGDAEYYEVFTPDLGELAFLADEEAAHPTYTRGFIADLEQDVPELIRRAYRSRNAARTLFVKGEVDYVCHDGEIVDQIAYPAVEALEPIGGTGDIITGVISALVYAGRSPVEACRIAGRISRVAGELSQPTPATQVGDIIRNLPAAIKKVL